MTLTASERQVVAALATAWNRFVALPVEHGDDQTEFRHLIHAAQEKVLARSARRQLNVSSVTEATDDPAVAGSIDIPSALSAFPGMKGFRSDAAQIIALIDVLVDGEPQTNLIAYDIDEGTVTRFVGNTDGTISLKRARDPANHETVTGTVTVVERED